MKKIVINNCFGGFGLSVFAEDKYCGEKGLKLFRYKQTKYKHCDGKNEHTRIDDPEDDLFMSSIFNDLGKKVDSLKDAEWFNAREIARDDELLISLIEEHGSKKMSGSCASLKVVEIPDGIEWEISEYDGSEEVVEQHQSWS